MKKKTIHYSKKTFYEPLGHLCIINRKYKPDEIAISNRLVGKRQRRDPTMTREGSRSERSFRKSGATNQPPRAHTATNRIPPRDNPVANRRPRDRPRNR